MPDPIDIPSEFLPRFIEGFSKATKEANKDLLVGLLKGFPSLKDDEFDDEIPRKIGKSVEAGVRRSMTDVEMQKIRADRARDAKLETYLEKRIKTEKFSKFEFNKDIGSKAIKSFSTKLSLPAPNTNQKDVTASFRKVLGTSGLSSYKKSAVDTVKEMIASGQDLNELMSNEDTLIEMRLKILKESILDGKIKKIRASDMKKLELILISSTKKEIEMIREKNEAIEKYNDVMWKVSESLERVPIFGKSLSKGFERVASSPAVKEKVAEKMSKFGGMEKAAEGEGIGMALKQGLKFGALLAALAAVAAAVAYISHRLWKLVGLAMDFNKNFVKATGTTTRFAEAMKEPVMEISKMAQSAALFGSDFEEAEKGVMEAAGGIVEEFGTMNYLTRDNLEMVTLMSQRLGVSGREAARIVGSWTKQLGLSGLKAKEFSGYLQAASIKYGLSFNQLLTDSAESAGTLAIYLSKAPKALAEALATARKLGTTIESQARSAQKFERFEDAISNAFTIQFITGQKINALGLYAQANYGNNALAIQEKLVTAFEKARNSQNLSVYAQRELASAMGLTLEEMNAQIEYRREERSVVKELSSLDKQFGTNLTSNSDKMLEYRKRAFRELNAVRRPGDKMDVNALSRRAEEIKLEEGRVKADLTNVMKALGITDLTNDTDKLLAKVNSTLDRILNALAGPIASAVMATAAAILRWMDTPIEQMSKEEVEQHLTAQGLGGFENGQFAIQPWQKYLVGPTETNTKTQQAIRRAVTLGSISEETAQQMQIKMKMEEANPFRGPAKNPADKEFLKPKAKPSQGSEWDTNDEIQDEMRGTRPSGGFQFWNKPLNSPAPATPILPDASNIKLPVAKPSVQKKDSAGASLLDLKNSVDHLAAVLTTNQNKKIQASFYLDSKKFADSLVETAMYT